LSVVEDICKGLLVCCVTASSLLNPILSLLLY
jgi:hypothetical protein